MTQRTTGTAKCATNREHLQLAGNHWQCQPTRPRRTTLQSPRMMSGGQEVRLPAQNVEGPVPPTHRYKSLVVCVYISKKLTCLTFQTEVEMRQTGPPTLHGLIELLGAIALRVDSLFIVHKERMSYDLSQRYVFVLLALRTPSNEICRQFISRARLQVCYQTIVTMRLL